MNVNLLKYIFRHWNNSKSSFFINLIGLTTGLTCAFLIYLWVSDEYSYDKFHKKDSQLFQVMTKSQTNEGADISEAMSWWVFAVAGGIALVIALLTVSWQSWRVATRNPVEALRYE